MTRWHALLAAVALLAAAAGQDLNRDFDPCQTGQVATVGQAYVLGLAYLPGGEPDAWFNGVDANGLPVVRHPCDPGDRAALGGALSVAAYSLGVEGLALLRADSGPLLGDALASEAGVLSVVAYNGDFVSAPRLIVSNSTQLTGNAGIVTSLNLVLNAQRGENVVASWDSRGCGTCQDDLASVLAGMPAEVSFVPELTCLEQQSCAVRLRSCIFCSAREDAATLAICNSVCSTSFSVGWAGTDSNSEALISSYILTQSTDFSIAGLFANNDVLGTVVDGITGLLGS